MANHEHFVISIYLDAVTVDYLYDLVDFFEDAHSSVLRKLVHSQYASIVNAESGAYSVLSVGLDIPPENYRISVRMDEYTLALLINLSEESGLSCSAIIRAMVYHAFNVFLQQPEESIH